MLEGANTDALDVTLLAHPFPPRFVCSAHDELSLRLILVGKLELDGAAVQDLRHVVSRQYPLLADGSETSHG